MFTLEQLKGIFRKNTPQAEESVRAIRELQATIPPPPPVVVSAVTPAPTTAIAPIPAPAPQEPRRTTMHESYVATIYTKLGKEFIIRYRKMEFTETYLWFRADNNNNVFGIPKSEIHCFQTTHLMENTEKPYGVISKKSEKVSKPKPAQPNARLKAVE